MTSFINPSYPTEHLGAERFELLTDAAADLGPQFKGGKGLIAIFLAGTISALVVVADQIVSTWTEGHLLMAWVTLWTFVFAAMALFAQATHGWTGHVLAGIQEWSKRAYERAQDERMWAVAQSDPRFMADIQAARMRSENDAAALGEPLPTWSFIGRSTHTMYSRPW